MEIGTQRFNRTEVRGHECGLKWWLQFLYPGRKRPRSDFVNKLKKME